MGRETLSQEHIEAAAGALFWYLLRLQNSKSSMSSSKLSTFSELLVHA